MLQAAKEVAVISTWNADSRVTRSLIALTSACADAGLSVLLVSTSTQPSHLLDALPKTIDFEVLTRPNVGYDFGSWNAGLEWIYANGIEPNRVLFLNDSLAGPFADMRPILNAFRESSHHAWGITSSKEKGLHIQSYAFGLSAELLRHRPIVEFWESTQGIRDRHTAIARGELALSRTLLKSGVPLETYFELGQFCPPSKNPTIVGWKPMLEAGFPMVKRQLLQDEMFKDIRPQVEEVVAGLFDTRLADWL